MVRTTAVQIEGLTKDMQYIKEKIDEGFKTTHEKQDKTNGRLLKLEENEKKLLPRQDFDEYKKEHLKEDSEVKKEKIISRRDITIAVIGAAVSAISILAGLKISGGI